MNGIERFIKTPEQSSQCVLQEIKKWPQMQPLDVLFFPSLKAWVIVPTAKYHVIEIRAEAAAYLVHPLLGARLSCDHKCDLLPKTAPCHIINKIPYSYL